jgi:hypothetical protein
MKISRNLLLLLQQTKIPKIERFLEKAVPGEEVTRLLKNATPPDDDNETAANKTTTEPPAITSEEIDNLVKNAVPDLTNETTTQRNLMLLLLMKKILHFPKKLRKLTPKHQPRVYQFGFDKMASEIEKL